MNLTTTTETVKEGDIREMKIPAGRLWRVAGLSCCLAFVTSCVSTQTASDTKPSPLTHGNVQLTLKKGVTTQTEVLENFGPPNVATTDASGNEVWTYQKHATVAKSSEVGAYGTVILLGVGGGTSGFERSSRTMTLIIKFGADKKIVDFKSMSTSF